MGKLRTGLLAAGTAVTVGVTMGVSGCSPEQAPQPAPYLYCMKLGGTSLQFVVDAREIVGHPDFYSVNGVPFYDGQPVNGYDINRAIHATMLAAQPETEAVLMCANYPTSSENPDGFPFISTPEELGSNGWSVDELAAMEVGVKTKIDQGE
jgi:hypothetical protein